MLSLDQRAKRLAELTPGVPLFVCRNLLMIHDRDRKEHRMAHFLKPPAFSTRSTNRARTRLPVPARFTASVSTNECF